MNYKEFILDNENIRTFRENASIQMGNCIEKLYNMYERVNDVVNTKDFQGQAAESIKNYFGQVYPILISSIITVASDFFNKINLYAEMFVSEVDASPTACIPQAGMDELKNHMNMVFFDLDSVIDEVNASLKSVQDIIDLDLIDTTSLAESFDDVKSYINKKEDMIAMLDADFCNNEISELEKLIFATKNLIQDYKGDVPVFSGMFSKTASFSQKRHESIGRERRVVKWISYCAWPAPCPQPPPAGVQRMRPSRVCGSTTRRNCSSERPPMRRCRSMTIWLSPGRRKVKRRTPVWRAATASARIS